MLRSPNNRFNYRQTPSSIGNYNALNELVMKSSSPRTSGHSLMTQNDKWNDDNRTLRKLLVDQPLNPSQSRSQTLEKLLGDQPLNPSQSLSRSSNVASLKSIIIEGQWKYRGHDDDRLRLKTMGIENLVAICHDIMNVTFKSTSEEQKKRRKSLSTNFRWPIVKLDEFNKLTKVDKASLNRARLLNLMTIVYEATTTNTSRSQLVRIWREASRPSKSSQSQLQPLISYEQAFRHLIRKPNNHLLEIALHASLISTHNQSDLQRLGEKLGVKRNQFDMDSIRHSTKAFQNLIKLLRELNLKQKQELKNIDTKRLPYKPKKKQDLYANVAGTRFRLIRQAVETSGFSISPDHDFTCNLLWNDSLISIDIVSALKPYQKVNHFPTMNEISRKDLLAANYDRLSNFAPKEYNFAPKTWILPKEYNLWYSYASNEPKKDPTIYIVKPINAAMGQGISICCDYKRIQSMDNYIIQEYIREPYLIEGFKFDIRIYALITSCDPLRVFIFNNGLVRISSKKYKIPNSKNAFNLSMHLTNYLIDENDMDDDFDTDNGKIHSLEFLFEYLKKQNQDVNKLWKEIQNIVIKTIFLAEPHILTTYRMCRPGILPTSESVCFELLGFDILIDKKLKPWVIEVNRCPSFDVNRQIEFDIKIKLLYETFDLLRFRVSDRKKSIAIEKIEAQRRLYSNIGKDKNDQTNELNKMKEILYLFRREKERENFENRHSGGFVRLFPVNDQNRMNELMNILTKCFQVLYTNKNDSSWTMKYYHQYDEEEILNMITRLEDIYQKDQKESSRLTYASNSSLELNRLSSSTSFIFEVSDDENELRSDSSRSDKIKKSPSSTSDSFMKRVSTQTSSNILRSSSLSPLNIPKQQSNAFVLTGDISRPRTASDKMPPGVSAQRITEKKAYSTLPTSSKNIDQQRSNSPRNTDQQRSHSLKTTKTHYDKSQMVTYSSIVQATRQQQLNNQSIAADITKELQLTDNDLNRLYQLILDQMNKLCIHYPNKSNKQTYRICNEIIENWNSYKSDIGRYWLVEFDANKRQSIIDIVWNNVQQIIKKVCILDELVQQLPLNRHLMKLQRRLLANHGQCLWDACQNKHNSWESLFVKSTNHLTNIELDCCYRFVDLCREALFIVYRYSIDEKIYQQKQIDQGLTVMIKS
ncbi:unnamed protein product [Rotaria sordida]|uniref:Uncharacterized protein n=1 Tax=Rotaria sordida TaxID=392033 RepID=A0A814XZ01_9BILA|nr:unnamed protein product [Rotaria sordida]